MDYFFFYRPDSFSCSHFFQTRACSVPPSSSGYTGLADPDRFPPP